MKQKEKDLLLRDICARLPYRVICRKDCKTVDNEDFYVDKYPDPIELAKYLAIDDMDITIKPYLRPMSSMTEEETKVYQSLQDTACSYHYEFGYIVDEFLYFDNYASLDYLNSIHVDYRGLIEKGLALEAPEGMYKTVL